MTDVYCSRIITVDSGHGPGRYLMRVPRAGAAVDDFDAGDCAFTGRAVAVLRGDQWVGRDGRPVGHDHLAEAVDLGRTIIPVRRVTDDADATAAPTNPAEYAPVVTQVWWVLDRYECAELLADGVGVGIDDGIAVMRESGIETTDDGLTIDVEGGVSGAIRVVSPEHMPSDIAPWLASYEEVVAALEATR